MPTVIDIADSSGSVFLDLRCTICHFLTRSSLLTAGRTSCVYMLMFCCVMMVPIDSALKDDSNGGHIVFWSNLDLYFQNLALEPDLDELGRK